MLQILSIKTDIQKRGAYIGQRQLLIDFASNETEGRAYEPDEFLLAVNEESKHKGEVICLSGGEPLLQINNLLPVLAEMPLPVYLQTNASFPDRLAEVKPHVALFGLEYVPDFQKEFWDSLLLVKDDDVYVRWTVDKNTSLQDVDRLAKMLGAARKNLPLILEPVFGSKNYLPLQAIARKYLENVKVIPIMKV